MVVWYVYLALSVAIVVSFWMALVESTYLTLRPIALSAESASGNPRATKAIRIVSEKTRLVSSTTFLSTFADVVLTGTTGVILSGIFGIGGWVLTVVLVSLVIMIFLNLLPKAIGIENTIRMALFLAPGTSIMLSALSPVTVPLTSVARSLSQAIVRRPGYKHEDLVDEFESLLIMLEKAGHIEPDAGRILRSALTSSNTTSVELLTPISEIVAVNVGSDVRSALKLMGNSNHPNLPVYDPNAKAYVGAVTFRSLFRAFDAGGFGDNVRRYMVQPAKVESDDVAATVMDRMRSAGVTMAFVSQGGRVIGMVTLTDILEVILGTKIKAETPPP